MEFLLCMALDLQNYETRHTNSTNQLLVENSKVFQLLTHEKDIMSERQMEHLIDQFITTEGFIPEIKDQRIYFSNNSDIKYIIDKELMKVTKVKKKFVGELDSM